jgi:hypothetical protein
MTPANHPHDPDRKGPNPALVIAILALIGLLMVGFLYFRPRPQSAIDKQSAPASAPHQP